MQAVYFGMAIQFCENDKVETLYVDVTSTAHKKDGPWVTSAMEAIFGFAATKKHDDPSFDRAQEPLTSTIHGGSDVLDRIRAVLAHAKFVHFWSDNGGGCLGKDEMVPGCLPSQIIV